MVLGVPSDLTLLVEFDNCGKKVMWLLFLFPSSSGFEIEPYPLTEMLCEVSSDTLLQGVTSQAPSVMSNRPGQASPPAGEELAKPMDSLQVVITFHFIVVFTATHLAGFADKGQQWIAMITLT